MKTKDGKHIFKDILKGKVVIIGIGNPLRGDDGFGPALINRIKGKIKSVCFDVGSAPENYLGKIISEKPDTLLIVDAAHLGLAPGAYRILGAADLQPSGLSTHDFAPNLILHYLQAQLTGTRIYILGVQPLNIRLGEKLSAPIKRTLTRFSQEIINKLKEDSYA